MERPSALNQLHTSPRNDVHSHEFLRLHSDTDEDIWRRRSRNNHVLWNHQHRLREGVDQRSTGISCYDRRFASEFLFELHQYTPGTERLSEDSQRIPDREAMGGLSRQAYTTATHVSVRRAKR